MIEVIIEVYYFYKRRNQMNIKIHISQNPKNQRVNHIFVHPEYQSIKVKCLFKEEKVKH